MTKANEPTDGAPRPPRNRSKEWTKDRIRSAAVHVIARRGFHPATTDLIAAQAGVSVGTLYNHFSSKDEILQYIFACEQQKRARFFRALAASTLTAPAKLERIVAMHLRRVAREPDLAQVILRERARGAPDCRKSGGEPNHAQPAETAHHPEPGMPDFIRTLIAEGVDQGEIRPCDPELTAHLVMGTIEAAMEALIAPEGATGPGSPASEYAAGDSGVGRTRRVTEEAVHLLRRGLEPGRTDQKDRTGRRGRRGRRPGIS